MLDSLDSHIAVLDPRERSWPSTRPGAISPRRMERAPANVAEGADYLGPAPEATARTATWLGFRFRDS